MKPHICLCDGVWTCLSNIDDIDLQIGKCRINISHGSDPKDVFEKWSKKNEIWKLQRREANKIWLKNLMIDIMNDQSRMVE